MKRIAIAIVVSGGLTGAATANDLANVYQQSITADPTMQQAEAVHMASRETKTQALLNMLPINATANKSWAGIGTGANSTTTNNPATATLGLSVNLFSWNSWINLKQAGASVAQAEANYHAARQELVSRVTDRYFAVLSAEDQLAAQESALQSAARQLEQAERRFEVGLIAITDEQIVRAARDSSSASVIAGRRSVSSAQEQLRAITGEKYARLASPRADMPLLNPDPASEDNWVRAAMDGNAELNASRLAADIAHDSYLAAFGGHLPNVTINASRNWLLNGNNTTTTPGGINTDDVTWSAGVSVPLFTAGFTQSKVRQCSDRPNSRRAMPTRVSSARLRRYRP